VKDRRAPQTLSPNSKLKLTHSCKSRLLPLWMVFFAKCCGKLRRQVNRSKLDFGGTLGLGRKVSRGTRPRLSWGRSVL
jgi:hypothetical protein